MISFSEYLKKSKALNAGRQKLSVFTHIGIYKEWKKQLLSKLYPIDLELPWISIIAKKYIEKYLTQRNNADLKVLEYGSGGSSLFFLQYADEVHSVEHDEAWFHKVSDQLSGRVLKGWKSYFRPPAVLSEAAAATLDASNPDDYFSKAGNLQFRDYVTVIDDFEDGYFDIVLVDGRSRPACVAHSMSKIKKGGLLVVDNAEREYYKLNELVPPDAFELLMDINSALICTPQFTQTNIYLKK